MEDINRFVYSTEREYEDYWAQVEANDHDPELLRLAIAGLEKLAKRQPAYREQIPPLHAKLERLLAAPQLGVGQEEK